MTSLINNIYGYFGYLKNEELNKRLSNIEDKLSIMMEKLLTLENNSLKNNENINIKDNIKNSENEHYVSVEKDPYDTSDYFSTIYNNCKTSEDYILADYIYCHKYGKNELINNIKTYLKTNYHSELLLGYIYSIDKIIQDSSDYDYYEDKIGQMP